MAALNNRIELYNGKEQIEVLGGIISNSAANVRSYAQTSYYINPNTSRIVIDCEPLPTADNTKSQYWEVANTYYASFNVETFIIYFSRYSNGAISIYCSAVDAGGSYSNSSFTISSEEELYKRHTIEINRQGFYLNGVLLSSNITLNYKQTLTNNFKVFDYFDDLNNNQTVVYGIKIYEGDNLVRQLTPYHDTNSNMYGFIELAGTKHYDVGRYGASFGYKTMYEEVRTVGSVFTNEDILSVKTIEEVSLTASDLAYDTLTATVRYEGTAPEAFRPMLENGGDYYDGALTLDNLIFSGHYQRDIRTTRYGVQVMHYVNNVLTNKFYVKDIQRNARNEYTINCVSAIGLLDKQYHTGNVYFGATVKDVLEEIIDGSIEFSVSSALANNKVYGWLPYDTKRNNLRQLLFSQNAHISKDADGNVVFGFLDSQGITNIDLVNTFDSGSEEYPTLATKAIITEHSYFFNEDKEVVELYNNTEDDVTDLIVKFNNAPIKVSTLAASEGLLVKESGVNYAIVSGNGTLYGKPYVHNTYNVIRTADTDGDEYEVTVTDATLVTVANSENVADRIMNYYGAACKVNADIKVTNERCGKRYALTDAFWENRVGFLAKAEKNYSSFIKASCEFIADYEIGAVGNNFNSCEVLTANSGVWKVPTGVNRIRAVLIGGGNGGNSGTAGESGNGTRGGRGGKGGSAGTGGKILTATIAVTPGMQITYGCKAGGTGAANNPSIDTVKSGNVGQNTTFYNYNSVNGKVMPFGVTNLFNESSPIYGESGHKGVNGGNGGNGDVADSNYGENVQEYHGGAPGTKITTEVNDLKVSWDFVFVDTPGGAGGGACATSNGNNGTQGSVLAQQSSGNGNYYIGYSSTPGKGGDGATPTRRIAAANYGCGGDGGHGGGGGGGRGQATNYDGLTSEYAPGAGMNYYGSKVVALNTNVEDSFGGEGGAGGNGARGCILVYY